MPRSCLYVLISKDSTLISVSAVSVHVSIACKKIDMTNERRSFTLDLRVVLLSIEIKQLWRGLLLFVLHQ